MKNVAKKLGMLVLIVSLMPNKVFAMSYNDEEQSLVDETKEILENVDMVDINSEKIDEKNGKIISDNSNQVVIINDNSISFINDNDEDNTEIGVEFPMYDEDVEAKVDDDIVVMSNEDENYMTTTEIFDGGVRNCFIIKEGCEEEQFPIEFNLPEGAHIEFAEDEYDNYSTDGSLQIVDSNSQMIGAIDIPWAKDADGNDVETFYEIKDDVVIQHVKHLNVEGIKYPIVADPMYTVGSLFDSAKWITRNGVVSLSLKPNGTLRAAMVTGSTAMKKYSWQSIYHKFHKSSKWSNTGSMKKQYYCHWYFAIAKSKFNLEPSRPYVSWFEMIKSRCNP